MFKCDWKPESLTVSKFADWSTRPQQISLNHAEATTLHSYTERNLSITECVQ